MLLLSPNPGESIARERAPAEGDGFDVRSPPLVLSHL